MAREPTPGLLERIVEAALMAFIDAGYRQTRVAEVARAAGVAPGTVYLYVEGKEALFELALRRAFLVPGALDVDTPYAAPSGVGHLEEIRDRLRATEPLGGLAEVEPLADPADPAHEFRRLITGLYRWQARYWRGIALIEASARDWPELFDLFYREFRREALERGAGHLERRAESGHYRSFPDARVAAHLIMETIAAFAMARHTAPAVGDIRDEVAERTVVEVLGAAFVPGWPSPLTH